MVPTAFGERCWRRQEMRRGQKEEVLARDRMWDSLQKPTISLKPRSRVFERGESIEISCFGNYPGWNFTIYRDDEFITSQLAPENNNTATFTPSEISAGNYWCKYAKQIDGRDFTSPESERVGISVRDSLQKPNISLKSDSCGFMRRDKAEISCSGNYPGSNFSLYIDGELIESQPAPENSNSAKFTPSEIRAGNYTCKYTTHIDGRQFTSPESERVGISVSANWTWIHTAGLAAGIFTAIVITVFIVTFCVYVRDGIVKISPRSVSPVEDDKTYTNLTERNRSENGCEAVEQDDPVYANTGYT
eukprot:gi/632987068/ref/XP_007910588.1/ PREDICTED: alpha-1B-glycoprotein-like [Callorhinchus milii]